MTHDDTAELPTVVAAPPVAAAIGCPSGTLVTLGDGSQRAIEAVSAGDVVMVDEGADGVVQAVHVRQYDGPLLELSTLSGKPLRLYVTPNLAMWASVGGMRFHWSVASSLHEGDCVSGPESRWIIEPLPTNALQMDRRVFALSVSPVNSYYVNGYRVRGVYS